MESLLYPDEVLLRRFGYVRAVGGAAYIIAVVVLFGIFDTSVWPLALGVPVLAVVTTWYFRKSGAVPRTVVAVSLLADALVLGGAVAFVGGTGAGLVMIYAIVIVSGGILLGPAAARGFTVLSLGLGFAQLAFEQLGVTPPVLYRPELGDRLPVLLISAAVLASVGYLTATYASRLHDLIAEAGAEAEAVRSRGRRRRALVRYAARDAREPLREIEAVAEAVDRDWARLGHAERSRLAARLRVAASELAGDVSLLIDVGAMDEAADGRPEPVPLQRVVSDVVVALGGRLDGYRVDVDVPPLKVAAHRRAARRVVHGLLENVVEHTPRGTSVRVTAVTAGGRAVLAVTDSGPGVPAEVAATMFDPPTGSGAPRVGLPLVAELCRAMDAEVHHEPAPGGGARFFVLFRLAPAGAPSSEEAAEA